MCGIFGGNVQPTGELLRHLVETHRHRGPDGTGAYFSPHAFLGLCRLAIIDPNAGAEPVSSENGQVRAVMNGEITNEPDLRRELIARGHNFKTGIDSEVLVHAYEEWGDQFVKRLNGMFAFILLDSQRLRLYAARDRFGIKPLYWRFLPGEGILFASYASSLAEIPGHRAGVSPPRLVEYLYRQSVRSPGTIFESVFAVSPGSFSTIELTAEPQPPEESTYWKVSAPARPVSPSNGEEGLSQAFSQAASRHARSDRHSLIALSGGIDSALMGTAVVREHLAEGAVFLDALSSRNGNPDRERARCVAKSLRIPFEELQMPGDFPDVVSEWVRSADQPTPDGLNVFILCSQLGNDVVVLFSGLGADELFNGYPELARAVEAAQPDETVRRFFMATALLRDEWIRAISIRLGLKPDLIQSEILEEALDHLSTAGASDGSDCYRLLLMKYHFTPRLLVDADVFSMRFGVEVRVPFLDNEITDIALAVPHRRMRGSGLCEGKLPLRRLAASRGLPPTIVNSPKRGFALKYSRIAEVLPPSQLEQELPLAPHHAATPFRTFALRSLIAWLRIHDPAIIDRLEKGD